MINLLGSWGIGGLILIFFWGVFGSLGIPGGMLTIVSAGTLANNINILLWIIVISFIASLTGDVLAYEIARKASKPLAVKLRRFHFFNKHEMRTIRLLERYGFYIVFFTRFALLSLCSPVSYIAGLQKFNRKKYFAAVFFGEAIYAVIYPTLGYLIGEAVGNVLSTINDIVAVLVLGIAAFYLGRFILKRMKK